MAGKMKYSLGTNFDEELLEYLIEYDKEHQIESLFGKLRTDIIGGGRASNVLPKLSMKELKNYIDKCKKAGIGFNYLLNPMCLGNREIKPNEHREILNFLNELQNIGVSHVTINSPYLCELIKKRFPELKVTIGLYAYIYSLQHVKYWESLGADELTLHHRVNRNFDYLKMLLTYTKGRNMKLRVIANNVCLHDCPYQINHGCGQAHASQEKDSKNCIYLDYNLLKCNYAKITCPQELISSEWIRPEDVHFYQEICEETDNFNFSIKLLERTKTTDFLKRVVKAYIDERYDGNLIDILTWGTSQNTKSVAMGDIYKQAVTKRYNVEALKKYQKVFELPQINIDNRKLDGFLDYFVDHYSCDKNICGNECGENSSGVSKCEYCKQWSDKAVSYDINAVSNWKETADQVLESMVESRIYGR